MVRFEYQIQSEEIKMFGISEVKTFKDVRIGDIISVAQPGRLHIVKRVVARDHRYITVECNLLSSNSSLYSPAEEILWKESNRPESFTYAKVTPIVILTIESKSNALEF
jgi:hypothetical protein